VEFPEGESARAYEGCIVECAWDGEAGVWRFLRMRTDKQTPNAFHVYEKVMQSIDDNITEDDLLAEIGEALKSPVYEHDVLHDRGHA
jgi:mRNA-capping enzyme